jgi:hypothetical protein
MRADDLVSQPHAGDGWPPPHSSFQRANLLTEPDILPLHCIRPRREGNLLVLRISIRNHMPCLSTLVNVRYELRHMRTDVVVCVSVPSVVSAVYVLRGCLSYVCPQLLNLLYQVSRPDAPLASAEKSDIRCRAVTTRRCGCGPPLSGPQVYLVSSPSKCTWGINCSLLNRMCTANESPVQPRLHGQH